MAQTANATRENRTITVDFHDEATDFEWLSDGKAFVEFILDFILSLGFQLRHQSTCNGNSSLTRHSHYARVRLGGLTIWRIQRTRCRAVFTVLPNSCCATVKCGPKQPAMPCWPPMAASVWSDAPPSVISHRWPCID